MDADLRKEEEFNQLINKGGNLTIEGYALIHSSQRNN